MLYLSMYILTPIKIRLKYFIPFVLSIYILALIFNDNYQIIPIILSVPSFIFFAKCTNSLLNSLFVFSSSYLIILVNDSIIGLFITNLFNLNYNSLRSNTTYYFISSTVIFISSTFSCFLAKKYILKNYYSLKSFFNSKPIKKILNTTSLLLSSFVILFICCLKYLFIELVNFSATLYLYASLLSIIIISLILYFFTTTLKSSIKEDYINKENKQLKEYTNMLENMSSDLRKFKHDYINILYTLGDYINEQDIVGLKKYYEEDLLPESKRIVKTDKNITLLKNIKITPLKALISSKLLTAQSQGIEINAEVFETIDSLSIKTIDICRIIGIFLDNAIEGTSLCEKKFIHIAFIKNNCNVIIVIINSCPEDIPPVFQLYQKNFSTKGVNRGIGLTSVKELIDTSYENILLNTSVSDNIFKQELIINNSTLT